MTSIRVERFSGDQLRRICWIFWVSLDHGPGITLILDGMFVETRSSTRKRSWTEECAYMRLSNGRSLRPRPQILTEEPTVPDDVLDEALERVRASVTYRSWTAIKAARAVHAKPRLKPTPETP